jgi:transposase
MFRVEIYGRVRRSVLVEGRSQREVAREFGISRKTIQKMLRYAVPPGYQRLQPVKRPKLGPWLGVIDAILEDDRQRPVKQRHTAKRIFDRLREEHGFGGGYTIVKDYVRTATLRGREMFVPLTHAAGEAQMDFGEALVVVAGVERKAHYLVMDLPHSDDCFVVAFPAETTEAFLEGHVRAFAYFGGVPTRILYDNTKIAVAKILGGQERQRTRAHGRSARDPGFRLYDAARRSERMSEATAAASVETPQLLLSAGPPNAVSGKPSSRSPKAWTASTSLPCRPSTRRWCWSWRAVSSWGATRTCCCSATPAPARRTSPWPSDWLPASAAIACASPPPQPWSRTDGSPRREEAAPLPEADRQPMNC